MEKIANLTKKIYSWVTLSTMSLGFIVAILFVTSIIIGGSFGESLAVVSDGLMTWAIRLATLAIIVGIINIYLNKNHTLTIDNNSNRSGGNEEEYEDSII